MINIKLLKKNHITNCKQFKPFASGMTLIETLVAVTALMIAVSGALSLAGKSLQASSYAKDQITAFYLAQEGLELVRNLRDANFIKESNWMSNIGPCGSNNGCYIDSTNGEFHTCGGGVCPNLRFDSASGLYGYNASWPETTFNRYTIIEGNGNDPERLIIVTITWKTRNINRSFVLKETLHEWYEEN